MTTARSGARSSRSGHRPLSDRLLPYLLMVPALILVIVVMVYPLALSVNMSVREGRSLSLDGLNERAFSFEHYAEILSGPNLGMQFGVSALYVAGTVIPSMVLGVALALLVSRKFPGRRILRPLVLLPWAVPGVIVSVAFAWILEKTYGVANRIALASGLVQEPIGWLTDPNIALIGVLLPTIWKTFPLFTIAVIAARSAIPLEFYEAARVDGAGPFKQFRHITLPGISSVLVLCVVLTSLSSFREFDFIYPLTGGGPLRSTETLAVGVYTEAFEFHHFENAAALGVLTLVISVIIVAVSSRRLRKEYF